jgi:predicted RNA-binding protein YlxR (DUF448 family)
VDQSETQIRTCIVTGEKHKKIEMIRLVSFRGEEIKIDLTGKSNGRGCYVSMDLENLDALTAKNGALLARVFRRQIKTEELEYLKSEFPKAVEEKAFRSHATKPVVVRIKKEDYSNLKGGS